MMAVLCQEHLNHLIVWSSRHKWHSQHVHQIVVLHEMMVIWMKLFEEVEEVVIHFVVFEVSVFLEQVQIGTDVEISDDVYGLVEAVTALQVEEPCVFSQHFFDDFPHF